MVNCTCGAGPMTLLISRTERNYMRRFYKCPLGKNHPRGFYWEDELMQNLPEAVHDDDAVGLRENGSASGMPWTVGGIMRCCGITGFGSAEELSADDFVALIPSVYISIKEQDTIDSVVYVPYEVMKQRMQVQGTRTSWSFVKPGVQMYGYYTGMFHAGCSIWNEHGVKGLYAGYWPTLARDVPFASLMFMFYEALKNVTEYGKQKWIPNTNYQVNSSMEGFLLGELAGGFSAYLATPLDDIKTRLQIQGSTTRYNGWFDAIRNVWMAEGTNKLFKGSVPRIAWYIPASLEEGV
ncbi:uncharacterized protein LOC133876082 [Alnus glutinosa]|uniref:uncharacterized protein LOC133876082 n=1 Tax=Alnus glutinosa TaxID=3517 RepID=UPI002D76A742|nr:uncharacterized protein LOC133876082 [Alnus glutinosa]